MVGAYDDVPDNIEEHRSKIYCQSLRRTSEEGRDFPDGLPNFFTLHYDATRVNFASHQRKTFDLAKYIKETVCRGVDDDDEIADIVRSKTIAIIGGGIGGLTCFFALHAEGFDNVHLFEMDKHLLGVQKDCAHRHGHPSAIDWPKRPINATTNLPLLNWGAGTADGVVSQMASDPFENRFLERKKDFIHRGCWVKRMILSGGTWQLEVDPPNRVQDFAPEILVNAQGFGVDKNIEFSSTDSYWWEDNLANALRERNRFNNQKFVVLGRGDGALIDFARASIGQGTGPDPVAKMLGCLRHDKYQHPNYEVREVDELPDFSGAEDQIREASGSFLNLKNWAQSGQREYDAPRFYEFRSMLAEEISSTHKLRDGGALLVAPENKSLPDDGRINEASIANQLLHCTLFHDDGGKLEEKKGKLEKVPSEHLPNCGDGDSLEHSPTALIKLSDGTTLSLSGLFRIVRNGPNRPLLDRMEIDGKMAKEHYQAVKAPPENFNLGGHLSTDQRKEILDVLLPDLRDEALSAETVSWDYRCGLLQRYLSEYVGLEKCVVVFARDPDGIGYLNILTPINPDVGSKETRAMAQRNHQRMIDNGGYDRVMFGGQVAWTHQGQTEQTFRGNSVPKRGAA